MRIAGCPQLMQAFLPLLLLFHTGYGKESQFIIPPTAHTHHFSSVCKLSTTCCVVKPYLLLLCSASLPGQCILQARNKSLLLAPKSFFRLLYTGTYRSMRIAPIPGNGTTSSPSTIPFGFIPIDQMFSHCYSGFVHPNVPANKDNKILWNQCLAGEVLLTQLQSLPP